MLESGTLLARKYELVRTAGFGGMAQLWVARNQATGAEICIKILLVPEQGESEAVERFRREAHAAARLTHRSIIRVFDLLELDHAGQVTTGRPAALAIVMELLHGETLGDLLMKRGALPLEEAIDVAVPIVSALAHAHRAGVVHRDLKPDNIFLATDPDGHMTPKVLDFGVSKLASLDARALTFDGVMVGTPSFMSPEQARGARNIDARTDVFASGILLYMMLAGTNPFEGDSFAAAIEAVIKLEPPRLPDVPASIWTVIATALSKDPSARFADGTELGVALRRASGRALNTESGEQLPPSAVPSQPSSRSLLAIPGDSLASVPPVSGGIEARETADVDGAPGRAGVDGGDAGPLPARRRTVRKAVMALLGASLVVVIVVVVVVRRRAPSDLAGTRVAASPTSAASAMSSELANVSSPAATSAWITTASERAVPSTPEGASSVTSVAGRRGGAKAATPPGKEAPAKPSVSVAPSASIPLLERSILRDPGF